MTERGIRFVPRKYEHLTCSCGNVADCDMLVNGEFIGVVGTRCCQQAELQMYNDAVTRPVVIPGFIVVDRQSH